MSNPDDPTLRHAHFLHRPKEIEPLLVPPVSGAQHCAWGEDNSLFLANRGGDVFQVSLDGGTRRFCQGPPAPILLAVARETVIVGTREGLLQAYSGEKQRWSIETELWSQQSVRAYAGGWVVYGDTADGLREVLLLDENGRSRLRTVVPARTVVGARPDGSLFVARSLESGLFCQDFGYPVPETAASSHVLRVVEGGRLVGLSTAGVLFWDGEARSMKMANVVNAAWGVEDRVVLGFRSGSVMATKLRPGARRGEVSGHTGAVWSMGVSPNGKMVATTATDGCRVWSLG